MSRAKPKTPSPPRPPSAMPAATFVREFARRQNELMQTMLTQISAGEIAVADTPVTDQLIENTISQWCQLEEPSLNLHLKMLGAVFLWALLDEAYKREAGAASNDNDAPDGEESDEPRPATAADVAVEAMKTIRSIWGKHA